MSWIEELDRLIPERRYAVAVDRAWEPPKSQRISEDDLHQVCERLFLSKPLFLEGCKEAVRDNQGDLLDRWQQGLRSSQSLPAFLRSRYDDGERLYTRTAAILASARAACYAKRAAQEAKHGTLGQRDTLLAFVEQAQAAARHLADHPVSTQSIDPATIRDQLHWPTLHQPHALVDTCYRLLRDGQQGVGVAQAWELTATLLGRPRPASRSRTLWALATRDGSASGFAVKLTMDLVDEGSGTFYPDPVHLGFVTLGASFQQALADAWQYARACLPAGVDVRWRIEGPSLSTLDGNSIGGALAVILQGLLTDCLIDDRCAVAAGVASNGHLFPVGAIAAKVRAAEQTGLRLVIVPPDRLPEARRSVTGSFLQVRAASTVAEAVALAEGLIRELREYYYRLIDALDRTPWNRRGEPIRATHLAIPVRVLKEEARSSHPGREGEDERSRARARTLVDPEIARLYEEPMWLKRREEVPWARELSKVERAIVIGSPGGGKTFLTEITAIRLAEEALATLQQHPFLDDLPFPIHVELTDLAQQSLSSDLADALMALMTRSYKVSEWLQVWMRERLTTRACRLILDALDQVDAQDRDRLRDRLGVLETQGWSCRVILTCRTANYDRALVPWSRLTEYELAPFRSQEIRQLIRRWFEEGDSLGQSLRDIVDRSFSLSQACRNPLLLTLTCLAHEEGEVTAEMRRGDLYARVLRGLVRRAWQEHPLDRHDPRSDDLVRLLESVGRRLFDQRPASNQFTNSEVLEAIEAVLGVKPLDNAAKQLRDELRDGGLLVGAGLSQHGELQFSFLHRSLLEYLTASSLAREGNGRRGWSAIAELIDRKAWDPAWQEVIILLAGKLHDPIPLLQLLSNPARDDYFRHRLCLAALCLPELRLERQT